MFVSDGMGGPGRREPGNGGPGWGEPGGRGVDAEAVLLALRRLAAAGPHRRCPAAEAGLLRRFGPCGTEIGAALRCLVMALAAGALRPVRLGCLASAPPTGDEALLLDCLRDPAGAARRLGLLIDPARLAATVRLIELLAGLMMAARGQAAADG
jgi:hypothetical protein